MTNYYEQDDLTDDEWYAWRDDLQDQYRFSILNPAQVPGQSYSLWYRYDDDDEQLALNSETIGRATFYSRDNDIGEAIEPTEEFLTLVWMATHEAMCHTPLSYFSEGPIIGDPDIDYSSHFEKTAYGVYDDKPREYEVWAAQVLSDYFLTAKNTVTPELRPLAQWADKHTEFQVPALHGDGSGEDNGSDTGGNDA